MRALLSIISFVAVMALAFWAYTIAMALYRVRSIILERERHTRWAQEVTA